MNIESNAKYVALFPLYGLTMVWSPIFGTSEASVFASLLGFQDELVLSRIFALAGYGASMLVFSLFGERMREAEKLSVFEVLLTIFGVAGMCLGGLVGAGLLPLPCLYAGGFLRGLFATATTAMWVDFLAKFEWREVGIGVAASLALYAVVILALAWVASVAPLAAAVLLAACPIAAFWGYRKLSALSPERTLAQSEVQAPPKTRAMFYAANFLYGIMLGAALYHYSLFGSAPLIAAFLAASFVMLGVFVSPFGKCDFHLMYRAFMMVVAVVFSAMVLLGPASFSFASVVASAILAVMFFYTVIIFLDTQVRLSEPFWKVPGICQVCAAVGMALSFAFFRISAPDGVLPLGLVILSAAGVIFVAGVFTSGGRSRVRPWGFSSLIPPESLEIKRIRRCGEIANEFRLTSRELEVLQQIAAGSTKDEIAEMLVISPATAKTHIRNIYSKLSVHSQSELWKLIDG